MKQPLWDRIKMWWCEKVGHDFDKRKAWCFKKQNHNTCKRCKHIVSLPIADDM